MPYIALPKNPYHKVHATATCHQLRTVRTVQRISATKARGRAKCTRCHSPELI